jgi:hypothetical protein
MQCINQTFIQHNDLGHNFCFLRNILSTFLFSNFH